MIRACFLALAALAAAPAAAKAPPAATVHEALPLCSATLKTKCAPPKAMTGKQGHGATKSKKPTHERLGGDTGGKKAATDSK